MPCYYYYAWISIYIPKILTLYRWVFKKISIVIVEVGKFAWGFYSVLDKRVKGK